MVFTLSSLVGRADERAQLPFVKPADYQYRERDQTLARSLTQPSLPGGRCALVSVYGVAHHQGRRFVKAGVGWVVALNEGQLQILTPAHVSVGADELWAACGPETFALRVDKMSESLDLSVLDFQSAASESGRTLQRALVPVLWLNRGSDPAPSDWDSWVSPHPADFSRVLEAGSTAQVLVPRRENENSLQVLSGSAVGGASSALVVNQHPALFSAPQALVLLNSDVRPGMSGGLLLKSFRMDSGPEPQILGMVVRAEANGSNTIALPLTTILQVLRGFGFKDGKDYFQRAGVYYQTRIRFGSDHATQEVRLIFEDARSKRKLEFSEECSESYPETADWLKVDPQWGQPQKDGLRQWGMPSLRPQKPVGPEQLPPHRPKGLDIFTNGSRGDYGDGSGGVGSQTPYEFKIFTSEKNGRQVESGVLRSERGCRIKGVRTPWGQRIEALWLGNHLERADSLGTVARVVFQIEMSRPENEDPVERLRRFFKNILVDDQTAGGGWPLGLICQNLGLYPEGQIYVIAPWDYSIRLESDTRYRKTYLKIGGNGGIQGQLMCGSVTVPRSAGQEPVVNSEIFFGYKPQGSTDPVRQFQIRLKPDHSVTGFLQVGTKPECRVELNSKTVVSANMWVHDLTHAKLKGQISIATRYPFFKLNLFDVAADCLEEGAKPYYLLEQVWDPQMVWSGGRD